MSSGNPSPLPIPSDGAFLLIDKPRGPSSHQVTAWVRDMLGVSRAGHAGTLDPGVSGLLVIAVGKALRLIPLVLTFSKRYVGVVQLHGPVERAALQSALADFVGPIYQTPPVRSAVKRQRRVRTIHSLEIIERQENTLLIDVTCESGTYVRTLAVDLGDALGVGGHLSELRRVATGPFVEEQLISLPMLSDAIALVREGHPEIFQGMLHRPEEVWSRVPRVVVKDSAVDALAHGADLAAAGVASLLGTFSAGDRLALVTRRNELIATGRALVNASAISSKTEGWVVDAESVFLAPGQYPRYWGPEKGRAKAQ